MKSILGKSLINRNLIGGSLIDDVWSEALNPIKVTDTMVDNYIAKRRQAEAALDIESHRTGLNRAGALASVGSYGLANAALDFVKSKNTIYADKEKRKYSFSRSFAEGQLASNPFGGGKEEDATSWIDVFDELFNHPTGLGKAGVVVAGVIGDIMLDYTNLLTGGISGVGKALFKGGKFIADGAKGVDAINPLTQHVPVINRYAKEFGLDISKGMDVPAAQKIIEETNKASGLYEDADTIFESAVEFSNRFNKLIGISGTRTNDFGISFRNMPFAERMLGKNAVDPKNTLVLVKGETLDKIGNAVNKVVPVAKSYTKLRDIIYGSKLTGLITKNSALYRLTKEKPEVIYHYLHQMDLARGLGKDKREAMKQASEVTARLLQLKPAQEKELLRLMEDKKAWIPITKMFKFTDTKEGQKYHAENKAKYDYEKAKIDKVKAHHDFVKGNVDKAEKGVNNAQKAIDRASEELANVKVKEIKDSTLLREFIRAAEENKNLKLIEANKIKEASKPKVDKYDTKIVKTKEEIESINQKIKKVKRNIKPDVVAYAKLNDKESPEGVVLKSKIDFAKKEIERLQNEPTQQQSIIDRWHAARLVDKVLHKDMQKELDDIADETGKMFDIKKEKKKLSGVKKVEKLTKEFNELWEGSFAGKKLPKNPTLPDMDKMMMALEREADKGTTSPELLKELRTKLEKIRNSYDLLHNKENKTRIIEDISLYLGGSKAYIRSNTYNKYMDEIMDMMASGKTREEINNYIADRYKWFNGRASHQYSWLAKHLKYDTWAEAYTKPLEAIYDKYKPVEKPAYYYKITLDGKELEFFDIEKLKTAKRKFYEKHGYAPEDAGIKEKAYYMQKSAYFVLDEIDIKKIADLESLKLQRDLWIAKFDSLPDFGWQEAFTKITSFEDDKAIRELIEEYIQLGIDRQKVLSLHDELNINENTIQNQKAFDAVKNSARSSFASKWKDKILSDEMYNKLLKETESEGGSLENLQKNYISKSMYDDKMKAFDEMSRGTLKDRTYHGNKYDNLAYSVVLSQKERYEIQDKLYASVGLSRKPVTRADVAWKERCLKFAERELADMGTDWGHASYNQKQQLIKRIKFNERMGTKLNDFKKTNEDLLKVLNKRKTIEEIAEIEQNVVVDTIIQHRGEIYTVKEIKPGKNAYAEYVCVDKEGYKINLSSVDEFKIHGGKMPENIDELIIKSEMIKERVHTVDEWQVKIEQWEKEIEKADIEFNKPIDVKQQKLKKLKADLKNAKARLSYAEKGKEKIIGSDVIKLEKEINQLESSIKGAHARADVLRKNYDRNKSIIIQNMTEMKKTMSLAEKKLNIWKNKLQNSDFDGLDETLKSLDEMAYVLRNTDAFDTWARSNYNGGSSAVDMVIWAEKIDVIDIVLKEHATDDDEVRELSNLLRLKFNEIAKQEISIGKLKPEQFHAMMMHYLPHIPTAEGKKFLSDKKQIQKLLPGFGDDYGYGREFNPHSLSRTIKMIPDGHGGWIKNPNVDEINDLFKSSLKGQNLFSDSIAEIFMGRMSKHTELMYDDKLMHQMLDWFGEDLPANLVPKSGYKTVMNFGMMKETVRKMTSMTIELRTAEKVSNFLKSNYTNPQTGLRYKVVDEVERRTIVKIAGKPSNIKLWNKVFSEEMSKMIQEFLDNQYPAAQKEAAEKAKIFATNWTTVAIRRSSKVDAKKTYDDIYKEKYDEYFKDLKSKAKFEEYKLEHEKTVKNLDLSTHMEDMAMPMVELKSNHVYGLNSKHSDLSKQYKSNICSKIGNFQSQLYRSMNGVNMDIKTKDALVGRLLRMSTDELRNHLNRIIQVYPDLTDSLQGMFKKIDTLDTFQKPQIKQMHDVLTTRINQTRKLQIAKDNNDLLVLYDKFTHFIKLNQTTILPAWHITNKKSNMFNNWLKIGGDAVNYRFQKEAIITMKNQKGTESVIDLLDSEGRKVGETTWEKMYELATEYGVIDEGYFAKDIGMDRGKGWIDEFKPYKVGAELGNVIENSDRLIHFMSIVRHGGTYKEAADSVNKFLFDYGDLTMFEAEVMKRIIPYYTWLRKNAALQLDQMFNNFGKYKNVLKIYNDVSNSVSPDDVNDKRFVNDFAQDWIQLPWKVKNPKNKDEYVYWNPKLPFMDLSRVPNPFDPIDSAYQLWNQSNPLLKIPVGIGTNYDTFLEKEIIDNSNVAFSSKKDEYKNDVGMAWDAARYGLSQTTPYGVVEDMFTKKGIDFGLHLINTFAGEKLMSYDYDSAKYLKIQEAKDALTNPNSRQKLEKGFDEMVSGLWQGAASAVSAAGTGLYSGRPLRADEYQGALKPISQSRYNKLSEEEKQLYTPPTPEEALALNKRAVELEKSEMMKYSDGKKLLWTMFEDLGWGRRNQAFVLGEVKQVSDGDTFTVDLGNGNLQTVRMLLIDTPESVKEYVIEQPGAIAASNYTKKALIGQDAKIIFDGERIDKFGRMLGYVEVNDVDLGSELLTEGLAKTQYIYNPPYDRLNYYRKIQNESAKNKKGIWNIPGYTKNDDKTYFKTQYKESVVKELNKRLK